MKKKTTKQKLPPGWSQDRLRKLAEHYDNQTPEERMAERDAARKAEGQTLMSVPNDLVPKVRALIARLKGA